MNINYLEIIKKFKEYTSSHERFIFNTDLEKININNVKFIVIGDNPGKNERVQKRYLIGAAGKMGRSFFESKFNINYSEEVITINKSTISTDKTEELKAFYNGEMRDIFINDQKLMAKLLFDIHKIKNIPVFIMGFSNYKKSGLWRFEDEKSGRYLAYYFNELYNLYKDNKLLSENIYFIKHFSMGRFHEQFKNSPIRNENNLEKLMMIGKGNVSGFFD